MKKHQPLNKHDFSTKQINCQTSNVSTFSEQRGLIHIKWYSKIWCYAPKNKNKRGGKIAPSEKRKVCASLPIQTLFISHSNLFVWNMDKNMVMVVTGKTIIVQFQAGYISFPALKHNKAVKEKVEELISSVFAVPTLQATTKIVE